MVITLIMTLEHYDALSAKNVTDFCMIESRDLGVESALNYSEAVDLCSAFNMTLPKLIQREDMIYVSQTL